MRAISQIVLRIAALLLLMSALIVPRMAWSAHEGGYDYQRAVAHVHHGDHTHAVSDHGHIGHKDLREGELSDAPLVHDHIAADVLSSMAAIADANFVAGPFLGRDSGFPERRRSGAPSGDPNTLLRPPRTA